MTNLFARLGKEKTEFNVKVSFHKIEGTVGTPVQMTLIFERGPQKDETEKFEMGPEITSAELDKTFERTSGFYFDKKKEVWFEKNCSVLAGYFAGPKWVQVAKKKMDMAPMVEKGETAEKVELIADAKFKNTFGNFMVELTFNITKAEPRPEGEKKPGFFSGMLSQS